MLNRSYATKEEIPAGFESLYKEEGGKFVRDDAQIEAVPAASGDITRLQTALNKEREAHKATKTLLTQKEAERATAAESAEALQLQIDAGGGKPDEAKIVELVNARVAAKVAPLNKKIDELNGVLKQKDEMIVAFQGNEKRSKIVTAVTGVALKEKVVEQGLEEVADIAARVMDLDDAGRPVTKDGCGFTPGIDPAAFLGELKAKRPYLWPQSVGGGAKGGAGGAGGKAWDSMSLTERGQYVREHGMAKADALAKASGYESAASLKKAPKQA